MNEHTFDHEPDYPDYPEDFAGWLDSILGHDEPQTIHDCIICGESPIFCDKCAEAYENFNPTIGQHLNV